jgi:hypothetical protein
MAMHRKATDLRHSLACVSCRIVSVCSNSERLAYMCTPSVSACAVEVELHGPSFAVVLGIFSMAGVGVGDASHARRSYASSQESEWPSGEDDGKRPLRRCHCGTARWPLHLQKVSCWGAAGGRR